MRAVQVTALSPDLSGCRLAEVPAPIRRPGQVLIEVRAAALNFPDLLMTRGEYQLKPELPFTPGMDVAGVVIEADEGSAFVPGQAVVGATRTGGLAEQVALDAGMVRPIPDNLSFAEAASFGVAYLTAYVALVRCGRVRAGEWLLVHGASGGVGLAAVDLGLALGARVIAASGSPEKLKVIAREYSPDATIVAAPGFRDIVKRITGGGADVIYDPVGGDVFDESTRCIAFGGRLLTVGFASGRIPTIGANIPLIKGFSVIGVRAGEYGRRFPDKGRENLDMIWGMAGCGLLRPRVHHQFSLERWRDAFELMRDRQLIGKVVLLLCS